MRVETRKFSDWVSTLPRLFSASFPCPHSLVKCLLLSFCPRSCFSSRGGSFRPLVAGETLCNGATFSNSRRIPPALGDPRLMEKKMIRGKMVQSQTESSPIILPSIILPRLSPFSAHVLLRRTPGNRRTTFARPKSPGKTADRLGAIRVSLNRIRSYMAEASRACATPGRWHDSCSPRCRLGMGLNALRSKG